jgi:hypothetical protein
VTNISLVVGRAGLAPTIGSAVCMAMNDPAPTNGPGLRPLLARSLAKKSSFGGEILLFLTEISLVADKEKVIPTIVPAVGMIAQMFLHRNLSKKKLMTFMTTSISIPSFAQA